MILKDMNFSVKSQTPNNPITALTYSGSLYRDEVLNREGGVWAEKRPEAPSKPACWTRASAGT